MASDKEKKEKLVNFLNRKAFDPVLRAKEDDYDTDTKKEKLRDVQKSTENEKERFANYNSAKDVKNNYLSDLSSETAKRKNKELNQLDLPQLPDFKDEFMRMCDDMEVR